MNKEKSDNSKKDDEGHYTFDIVLEKQFNKEERVYISSPSVIYDILKSILANAYEVERSNEHFFLIGLDKDDLILSISLVALGSYNSVIVNPLTVFNYALFHKAKQVIIAHNHPDNTLDMSKTDIEITDVLYQFGKMINITLKDSMIITLEGYYSALENGLIDDIEKSLKFSVPYMIRYLAIQEGIDIGRWKGIKKEKINIVKKMLDESISKNIISRVTEISLRQINLIQKQDKRSMARRLLLTRPHSIKQISKITGVDEEDVKKIEIKNRIKMVRLMLTSKTDMHQISEKTGFLYKEIEKIAKKENEKLASKMLIETPDDIENIIFKTGLSLKRINLIKNVELKKRVKNILMFSPNEVESISEATGLSIKELNKMKEELGI